MPAYMRQFATQREWLEARKERIGGSDASAVIGCNPYKTNLELWQEKTGLIVPEDISHKPYVQYGHDAEPLIRELFKLDYPQYKVLYEENNLWTNDKYPFAHASLDGYLIDQDNRHGILEIKTTNILQSMQKEKWKDGIPQNYYVQILHYLMVHEDCEYAHLIALLRFNFDSELYEQVRNYHIERQEVQEDINYLITAEKEFWGYVQIRKKPPVLLPDI